MVAAENQWTVERVSKENFFPGCGPRRKQIFSDLQRLKVSISRLSCVHVSTFLPFDDYRLCNFECTTPPRAFIFALDIIASVWDLKLGYIAVFLAWRQKKQ